MILVRPGKTGGRITKSSYDWPEIQHENPGRHLSVESEQTPGASELLSCYPVKLNTHCCVESLVLLIRKHKKIEQRSPIGLGLWEEGQEKIKGSVTGAAHHSEMTTRF